MNPKIRWVVIGSGGIARRRTIPEGIVPSRNAQLVAVCDVNTTANAEVAAQFGSLGGTCAQFVDIDNDGYLDVITGSPDSTNGIHLFKGNGSGRFTDNWELSTERAPPKLKPGTSHLYSRRTFYIDEDSWQILAAEKGAKLVVVPVDDRGEVHLADFERLIGPRTRIVAVTQVSNALGTGGSSWLMR